MSDRHAWLYDFRAEDRAAAWFDFLMFGECFREGDRRIEPEAGRAARRRAEVGDVSPLPADARLRSAVLDYLQARCEFERASGFGGSANETRLALGVAERTASALGGVLAEER